MKFDPDRLEVRGSAVSLLDDLAANPVTGGGEFDFSHRDLCVYARQECSVMANGMADSSGKKRPLMAHRADMRSPAFPGRAETQLSRQQRRSLCYDLERDDEPADG